MRIPVGGIAPDRFAQPVGGGGRILVQPVGVAEIEAVVGVGRLQLRGLVEEVGGPPRLRAGPPPQLHDPHQVRHHRRRRHRGEHLQRRVRLVVAAQLHQRRGAADAGVERLRIVHRHALQGRDGLVVGAARRLHVPQRQPRIDVARGLLHRLRQVALLQLFAAGGEAAHVELEGLDRRREATPARGAQPGGRENRASASKAVKQSADRRDVMHGGFEPGGVHLQRLRVDGDVGGARTHPAEDDPGRADQLRHLDDRRPGQGGARGQLQPFEGGEPLVASDHRHAATGQRRRQADGRALAEPADPGIEFVLRERHDQGAGRRCCPGPAPAGWCRPRAASGSVPLIRRRQRSFTHRRRRA